jgi:hypothetical protein
MNPLASRLKRWLFLVHRWLGIPLCLVMALWFLSGMVMLYVGYPKLTTEERHQGLAPLQTSGCCVPLAVAWQAAALDDTAQVPAAAFMAASPASAASAAPRHGNRQPGTWAWRLANVAGEPHYLFTNGGQPAVAVQARSGQRVTAVDATAALASARHFAPGPQARHRGLVTEDAWTHSRALDGYRPLHVVALDGDAAGRWLYVSSRTGEVVRDASFTERSWGWVGAWLHWLYMFRGNAFSPWYADIVIWLSIAGTVAALSGMVVGLMRWRWRGAYRSGRKTPYPGRAARWHHWLGMAGGLLAITWVFSGLMSMNPWKVFDPPGPKLDRVAYAGGPLRAADAPAADVVLKALQQQGHTALELDWQRLGGVAQVVAQGPGGPWVVDADGLQPDGVPEARWREAANRLMPGAKLVEAIRLSQFDTHYYAREAHTMSGHRERPLPVWRLRFDDANATWLTIDPRTGALLQISDSHRRADRWLFAFLHSFDLPALLASRPAWDVGMLGFSLAGLGLSLTAVVTGWRRLRRQVPHARPASQPPAAQRGNPSPAGLAGRTSPAIGTTLAVLDGRRSINPKPENPS